MTQKLHTLVGITDQSRLSRDITATGLTSDAADRWGPMHLNYHMTGTCADRVIVECRTDEMIHGYYGIVNTEHAQADTLHVEWKVSATAAARTMFGPLSVAANGGGTPFPVQIPGGGVHGDVGDHLYLTDGNTGGTTIHLGIFIQRNAE